MASDDDKATKAKGVSTAAWLIVMVVFTLIAGGAGSAFGLYLSPKMTGKVADAKPDETAPPIANENVRELPPIITNLDQTSGTWVRLHAAVVMEPGKIEKPDVLTALLADDIMGFLQTLTVSQLSGASGLQHLREDLNERAVVRSEGKVHELVIESLVVQ